VDSSSKEDEKMTLKSISLFLSFADFILIEMNCQNENDTVAQTITEQVCCCLLKEIWNLWLVGS
jgi:hypothetical protein